MVGNLRIYIKDEDDGARHLSFETRTRNIEIRIERNFYINKYYFIHILQSLRV